MKQRKEMIDAVANKRLSVKQACEYWNVSRDTFYVWKKRFETEGEVGLLDRSSRPHNSPRRMDWRTEALIVELRKAHKRWGARRIRAELKRAGWKDVPVVSAIHMALVRNELIVTKVKEPKAVMRFERQVPGELVQTDAKDVILTTGKKVHVISIIDDHSRYCLVAIVKESLDSQSAIEAFDIAVNGYGFPFSVLTDRGTCFTGKTKQTVNAFERHLWSYGVITLNGRPYHPQTQGKIERYHRTLSEWLEDNGPFSSIPKLQLCLDEFSYDYNHLRPHQGIEDQTPAERLNAKPWKSADVSSNANRRQRRSIRTTQVDGRLGYSDWTFGFGKAWARHPLEVIDYGFVIEIKDSHGNILAKFDPKAEPGHIAVKTHRGFRSLKE